MICLTTPAVPPANDLSAFLSLLSDPTLAVRKIEDLRAAQTAAENKLAEVIEAQRKLAASEAEFRPKISETDAGRKPGQTR